MGHTWVHLAHDYSLGFFEPSLVASLKHDKIFSVHVLFSTNTAYFFAPESYKQVGHDHQIFRHSRSYFKGIFCIVTTYGCDFCQEAHSELKSRAEKKSSLSEYQLTWWKSWIFSHFHHFQANVKKSLNTNSK